MVALGGRRIARPQASGSDGQRFGCWIRQLQDDVDRWAEREGLRPVQCLSAWIVGIPLKPFDFAEAKEAVAGGISVMWMPPVTSAWSIFRLGGRGKWFDPARRIDEAVRHYHGELEESSDPLSEIAESAAESRLQKKGRAPRGDTP